ncbi:hypothetical protein HanXRQr2_Chr03g0112691 [Helianthus annuus]|uniref:Uncharacterized protein n=1 Tax=Helianthus annuus TaxID=4232 RepID=A0A9K3NW38_HELAN|nr:hypothetical protein HanXRQr2_Chr03g0112691 [Helianthus annuus]KAJ0943812.1 hypothetical protein HanPSC8_Chr03g0109051 [Helianthus annuus]
MSKWMGALKANGLRRLNQISERKYGCARLYRVIDISSRSVRDRRSSQVVDCTWVWM